MENWDFCIDIDELIGIMAKKGFTKSSVALKLGISRNTMAKYFKNPASLPYYIIINLVSILEIPPDQAKEIFFSNKLANTQKTFAYSNNSIKKEST